jgi:hypothetical protein
MSKSKLRIESFNGYFYSSELPYLQFMELIEGHDRGFIIVDDGGRKVSLNINRIESITEIQSDEQVGS